ncbi:hypothetical protein [Smaragdicoccus niigatensis]|uniref:hypothetical protein n=1 Tax=Smaragdicoccus niigatensis TaxID=359359 RepID=UPI0003684043|nr:hypothetical protein [Smaragdicoccus niigatensis]
MNVAICTVLSGRLAPRTTRDLEAALKSRYRELFAESLTVVWLEVPPDQAFTNGKPSSMSWLLIPVADGLDQAIREKALTTMAADWARIANCDPDDIMIAMPDASVQAQYLKSNRERIPLGRLPEFLLRTGVRVATGFATRRTLSTTANF